jgi:membrane-associated phospholipid phosphatase
MKAILKCNFRGTMRKILILIIFINPFEILSAQNFDINLLRNINIGRNASLDPAFRGLTNAVAPVVVAAPVLMFGAGYLKHDSALKRNAVYVGVTLLTATTVTLILKYSIDRPRPFETYSDIEKAASTHTPSFPSGHTSSAFSLATSLSLTCPKWYIIVPSYSWALTVAYSRMHLGVHYPSDVFIGALIGAGSAYLCYQLNKKLRFSL